ERDYPAGRVFRLEQNYRSSNNSLAAASSVVANNRERKGKQLWTEAAAGASIGYCLAPDAEQEAAFAVQAITAQLGREPATSVAILYRTNAQSRLFEEALRRANLAYRVLGGFSFYERAEVRDLLAYLRAAANPADSIAVMRVINTPPRGIGKVTLDALERLAQEHNLTALEALERALEGHTALPQRALIPLGNVYKLLRGFRQAAEAGVAVDALLRQILDESGYGRALQAEATPEAEGRLENLGELLNAATDAAARGEGIAQFLDHAALVSDQDDYDPQATVQLMSLHAAKGLEFELVILAGLEEGLFPHSRAANSPAEMEEERRLCYVGMTRARQRLYLTHAARRRRYAGQSYEPSAPSRFLAEVPAELLEDLSPADPFARPRAPRPPAAGGFRNTFNSVDSIHQFFQGRSAPAAASLPPPTPAALIAAKHAPASPSGLRPGARVRHSKFGVGTVLRVEGDGDLTKLTISFPGYGLKKILEKIAALAPV
ncbi:MAG: ATP-dependent helicase, partial [Terriglobales bacterium]